MSKLKVLLFMLSALLLFSCKSAPKQTAEQPKQAAEEIEQTEQPVQVQAPAEVEPEKPEPATSTETGYAVYFAPLSYTIDRFTAQKLDDIGEELASRNVKRITVTGHSAKLDSEKEEELIAFRRAVAVAQYFQDAGLFDSDDIVVEGRGAKEPAASHNEISDRFKNRRVEIQSAE